MVFIQLVFAEDTDVVLSPGKIAANTPDVSCSQGTQIECIRSICSFILVEQ